MQMEATKDSNVNTESPPKLSYFWAPLLPPGHPDARGLAASREAQVYTYGLYSYGLIVMAYTVMAYIVMAYIVMAYIVMAFIVMAYIFMAAVCMACAHAA